MRWRALDAHTIRSDTGHQISKSYADGVPAYSVWGPPGSASEEQRALLAPTMALAAEMFGCEPQADTRAVARAQRLIGVYACPQEARAACEDEER
jgi:hypothetical protein